MFITSSPTLLPTMSPIISAPTSAPSFIGLIISVDITTTTTTNIDTTEITELETLVAESYGVDIEDVSTMTEYATTGTLTVTIPDTISEDEALEELSSALALALDINEDIITLSLDAKEGVVSYTITNNNFDQTDAILSDLQNDDIIENIDTNVVIIDSVSPIDEIIAEVTVAVNADKVEVSFQQAENRIDALLDDNYSSDVTGNFSIVIEMVFIYELIL